jgi:KDO2-lipid IV(A) lauroyltransferase
MSEFIVGNPLRKLARKHPALRTVLLRLDFALVWIVKNLSRLLPVDLGSRLGRRIGTFIGPRLASKTIIYRDNLAIAFPQLSDEELDGLLTRAWGQAGRILTEFVHFESILKDPDRLEIDIREPIATYSDPSQPFVLVTAHQSNWEIIGAAMAKLGIPYTCLYTPPSNPLLDRLLLDSRRALNCELIPRENCARPLMRAMQNGRTAAMVMDRRVDDGEPIRFFGHDKLSTLLPAKLALKFNCALVPVQVERLKDARFRVTFHPPLHPGSTVADENSQAIDLTQQIHAHFEDWIRQNPQDWFCSKRLWPRGTIGQPEEVGSNADAEPYAN